MSRMLCPVPLYHALARRFIAAAHTVLKTSMPEKENGHRGGLMRWPVDPAGAGLVGALK